jgi:acyl-coenzyme A thioesterase PaaI-like protein
MIGRVELAMTTSMTVHFLSRPRPEDVRAEGRLLKLGRRLAVGEVVMRQAAAPHAVCHVTGTYAIPPERG